LCDDTEGNCNFFRHNRHNIDLNYKTSDLERVLLTTAPHIWCFNYRGSIVCNESGKNVERNLDERLKLSLKLQLWD
jgi:hypothetical protein